jgi:hypothetical protein
MKKPSMRPVFATMLSPITSFWPGFKQAANWLLKEDMFFQTMLPQAHTVRYEVLTLESGAERLKFHFGEKSGDEAYAEFLATIHAKEQRQRWPANLNGLDALIRKTIIDRQVSMTEITRDRVKATYRSSSREDRDLLREMIGELGGGGREAARDALLMTVAEIDLAGRETSRMATIRAEGV